MNAPKAVSANEVRDAVLAAEIHFIPHHTCGLCEGMVAFFVSQNGTLFFDPSCDCSSRVRVEPRSWQDAADWINMQSNPEVRIGVAARFGLVLTEDGGA